MPLGDPGVAPQDRPLDAPVLTRVSLVDRETAKATATGATASTTNNATPGSPSTADTRTVSTFLPVSFTRGTLLGGLDAPTGGQAQSNPHPVLIRLSDNSVLPNRFRGEYRDCFVIAAGYGDISSERAYLRTENLSCVRPDGATLEVKIQGSVYGEDGKVGMRGRLVTKQGQTLNSFQTTPTIVMLAKLDVMTVRAEIAEADVDKIQLGQTVWFTTLGSGRQRHTATIERIEPAPASIATDATAGAATATGAQAAKAIYYNAQFDVPNPEGKLRPSMTAQVTVRVAQADKAVLMPAAALGSRDADDNYSVRVRDAQGQVTERKVRVGLRTNAQAQVLSGLEPGEQVVIGEASPGGKPAGSDPMGM